MQADEKCCFISVMYMTATPWFHVLFHCMMQIGERYKCLSYMLDMLFKDIKDTQDHSDNVNGWSTARAIYMLFDGCFAMLQDAGWTAVQVPVIHAGHAVQRHLGPPR